MDEQGLTEAVKGKSNFQCCLASKSESITHFSAVLWTVGFLSCKN